MQNLAPAISCGIKDLNTEFKRIDRWCESTIKLSFLASALFASIGLVFHHFKSVDSMRLSFYLFGANLAIAVVTSIFYIYIINKKNAAYAAASTADGELRKAQKDYYEYHSKLNSPGLDESQKNLNQAQAALFKAQEKLSAAKLGLVEAEKLKIQQNKVVDREKLISNRIDELKLRDENKYGKMDADMLKEFAENQLLKEGVIKNDIQNAANNSI